jgi:glycosyltransferase involved in cell wall biosynthesis
MKVAVVFDNFGPYHLARLEAAGQVCDLLALEMNQRSSDYAWQPRSRPPGLHCFTLDDGRKPYLLRRVLQLRRLRRALDDFSPDCVFIPGWSRVYSLESVRWCLAKGIPSVIMSESTEHDAPRRLWKEWLKRRIVRTHSAGFVGGAPHRRYLEKLGLARSKIFEGYDVVDNNHFQQAADSARERSTELRKSLQLPENYFLASARFIEKKNLRRLLLAFSKYANSVKDLQQTQPSFKDQTWSLVLLGDGPQRTALRKLVSDLGLEKSVWLPGFKQYDELPVYYGLARVFVHASASEPWGLVVNEAMASGLPVIVSDRCGCAQDLVHEDHNGFAFDPLNVGQLARLMFGASQHNCLHTSAAKASREIISLWDLKRFASGFRAAAETAIQSGHSRIGGLHRLISRSFLSN